MSWSAWAGLVYSALFSLVAAYVIWYTAVRELAAAVPSIYSNIVPLVAMAVAAVVLDEPLTAGRSAAPLAILGGVALTRLDVGGRGWTLRQKPELPGARPVAVLVHSTARAPMHRVDSRCAVPSAARRCARSWWLRPFRPAAAAADSPPPPSPTPIRRDQNPCLTAALDAPRSNRRAPRRTTARPQRVKRAAAARRRSARACARQPLGACGVPATAALHAAAARGDRGCRRYRRHPGRRRSRSRRRILRPVRARPPLHEQRLELRREPHQRRVPVAASALA